MWNVAGSNLAALIAVGHAAFGQDPLPQLNVPGPKRAGAGQQVVTPHAVEALSQLRLELRPGLDEVVMPGHQRLVIIGAEVMQIFYDKQTVHGVTQLSYRGQVAIGEYIF